jgi:methionine-S-sulfoxide reductase
VPGVIKTNVGYWNGAAESPTYEDVCSGNTGHAEVVQVAYDTQAVSLDQLFETFWSTLKDPADAGGQGNDRGSQYRAGVYFHTDAQKAAAEEFMVRLPRPVQACHAVCVDCDSF